jgi:phosphoribosylanthranilate isomerase
MSSVKLKICGIKSVGEARAIRELPVDYLGLNFIPASTRYVSLDTAQAIVSELHGHGSKIVGLFAGQPLSEVNDYAHRLRLDCVQLHGDEPADYAQAIEAPVIRAIAVPPEETAEELLHFIERFPADYFVLDRQLQGHGQAVNLDLAAEVIEGTGKKIFFAGGLTHHNLSDVLAKITPYGIDIAGGVRVDNQLDLVKVEQCIMAANQVR